MSNTSTAVTISGQAVVRARLRKGMTLRQLADACEELGSPIDYSFLSRIERGLSQPRPRVLPVLAQALDLTVDDLFAAESGVSAA